MIGGIIIAHGPIAEALIRAVEGILGKTSYLYGFSTSELSRETIQEQIASVLASADWPDETLIMVTLKGGSCWHAAISTMQLYSNISVVSGVNLPMLLSFVTKRNGRQLDELATMVKEDGIRGIDKFEGLL